MGETSYLVMGATVHSPDSVSLSPPPTPPVHLAHAGLLGPEFPTSRMHEPQLDLGRTKRPVCPEKGWQVCAATPKHPGRAAGRLKQNEGPQPRVQCGSASGSVFRAETKVQSIPPRTAGQQAAGSGLIPRKEGSVCLCVAGNGIL